MACQEKERSILLQGLRKRMMKFLLKWTQMTWMKVKRVQVCLKALSASLEEIKERVVDAGYETSELFDMQKEAVTSLAGDVLVDGFNIVIGSVHNFVMEFKTPEDAQEYADMINEGGYSVAIVNGRFLTSVEATKGIIEDEELQAELEAHNGCQSPGSGKLDGC
jgi:hypothetical protein